MRDITAAMIEKPSGTGAELVDDNQRVYLPIFDLAPAAPNCPTNNGWTETNDPRVRVARKVVEDTEHGEQFPELQDGEMLAITSKDLQRDYAFHRLGRTVETWMVDQKLGCPDTRDREEVVGTEVSTRA